MRKGPALKLIFSRDRQKWRVRTSVDSASYFQGVNQFDLLRDMCLLVSAKIFLALVRTC